MKAGIEYDQSRKLEVSLSPCIAFYFSLLPRMTTSVKIRTTKRGKGHCVLYCTVYGSSVADPDNFFMDSTKKTKKQFKSPYPYSKRFLWIRQWKKQFKSSYPYSKSFSMDSTMEKKQFKSPYPYSERFFLLCIYKVMKQHIFFLSQKIFADIDF